MNSKILHSQPNWRAIFIASNNGISKLLESLIASCKNISRIKLSSVACSISALSNIVRF